MRRRGSRSRAVPLALDAPALPAVGRHPDGGVVAPVGDLELAQQAVQVALKFERLRVRGFERRIALADRLTLLRELQRGRIDISLLGFLRRAQEVLGRLRPQGSLLEMVREDLDDRSR